MKPILKWAGGKTKIRDIICNKVSNFNDYWEPFCGSAAVALKIYETKDCNIFLNDINDDLINFYNLIKTFPENCIVQLAKIQEEFNSSLNKRESYILLRNKFNLTNTSSLERGVLFYFLNKTSFNGLTRYNSSGGFNVPFGNRDFSVDFESLKRFSEFLNSSRVHLSHDSYTVICPQKFDFVYLDPPYHPINTTSNFTSYHTSNWSDDDELCLKSLCDCWNKDQIQFVLSNNDVEFIRNLFAEYEFSTLDVRKSVGAKKETRKKTPELLIFNKIALQPDSLT